MAPMIRSNPSAIFHQYQPGAHTIDSHPTTSSLGKSVNEYELHQRRQRLIATRQQAKQFSRQQHNNYKNQHLIDEEKYIESERIKFNNEKQQKIQLLSDELNIIEKLRGKAQCDAAQYQQQLIDAAAAQSEYNQKVSDKQSQRYSNARTIQSYRNNADKNKLIQFVQKKQRANELAKLNKTIVTKQNELRHEQYPATLQFNYEHKSTKQLHQSKFNLQPDVHIEVMDDKLKQLTESAQSKAAKVSATDRQRQIDAAEQRRINESAERQQAMHNKALIDIEHERNAINHALNQLQNADKLRRDKQMKLHQSESLPRTLSNKHTTVLSHPDHMTQQQLNKAFERELPVLKQPQLFNKTPHKQQAQSTHAPSVLSPPHTNATKSSVLPSRQPTVTSQPVSEPTQITSKSLMQSNMQPATRNNADLSTLSNNELDSMLEKLIAADKRINKIATKHSNVLDEYERNLREYHSIDNPVSSFNIESKSPESVYPTLHQQPTTHLSISSELSSSPHTTTSTPQQLQHTRTLSTDSSLTSSVPVHRSPLHAESDNDDVNTSSESDLDIDRLIAQRNASPTSFAAALNDAVDSYRQRNKLQYKLSNDIHTNTSTNTSSPVRGTISINISGNEISDSMSGSDALAVARRSVHQSLQVALRNKPNERKYDHENTSSKPHNKPLYNDQPSLNTSVVSSSDSSDNTDYDDVVTSQRNTNNSLSLQQSFQRQKPDFTRRSHDRQSIPSTRQASINRSTHRVDIDIDNDTPLSTVRDSSKDQSHSFHRRDRSREIRHTAHNRFQQLPEVIAANQQSNSRAQPQQNQQRAKQYDTRRRQK